MLYYHEIKVFLFRALECHASPGLVCCRWFCSDSQKWWCLIMVSTQLSEWEWDWRASDNEKQHPQQHSITPSLTQQLTPEHLPPCPPFGTRPPTSHGATFRSTLTIQAHRHVHTHPGAHLLSKSRKKCGQFSKSLPRTLMRFPMASDLDGRKQQNAYRTWQRARKHTNTQQRHGEHLGFV